MNIEDRKKQINELREICQEIGCSGLDPDMCQNRPYRCGIIRNLVMAHQQVNEVDVNKAGRLTHCSCPFTYFNCTCRGTGDVHTTY